MVSLSVFKHVLQTDRNWVSIHDSAWNLPVVNRIESVYEELIQKELNPHLAFESKWKFCFNSALSLVQCNFILIYGRTLLLDWINQVFKNLVINFNF